MLNTMNYNFSAFLADGTIVVCALALVVVGLIG